MKVRDYIELKYHFTSFKILSSRTGKKLFGVNRVGYMSEHQKIKLQKFLDWEVSAVEPFIINATHNNNYIALGISISVPEWNGEQL